MIILGYSRFDDQSIERNLGVAEYSYWFVRRAFWPLLDRFGIVLEVTDPAHQVDAISATSAAHDRGCVYFSFDAPHNTVLGMACPTIPVFAWEFDTIPHETWGGEARNDWRMVLHQTGCAITHSSSAVAAVRAAMGADFPIWCIPAPMFDRFSHLAGSARGWRPHTPLLLSAIVLDAGLVDMSWFSMRRAPTDGAAALQALRRHSAGAPPREIVLAGVVYTAIFNPMDGRKNWADLLAGFIWAFRDMPDATLILKITYHNPVDGLLPVLSDIAKLGSFSCRIILVHGMLADDEYAALLAATSYTVNTSTGEGQCLPLMEYMSAGRPAIAPIHSAMRDYVTPENGFPISYSQRPQAWPHDSRQAVRCVRHVISFTDLVRAYRESYFVARDQPERYRAMSAHAVASLAKFCADSVVEAQIAAVLRHAGLLDPVANRSEWHGQTDAATMENFV